LTSMTIPARAEEFAIDDTKGIFKFCTSLVNIDVEAGNAYYSSIDGVLCDAKRTTIIYCPGSRPGVYTVPVGINTIGNSAFRGCTKLTSIVISPYVSSIEANAFYGCSKITSVTFRGKAITDCTIGQYAFANCAMLADITFETGSRVVSLDNYAFSTCKSILSVTIPATMKSIGSNAFGNCSSLASVKFEENGSEITFDKNVFYSCTGLVEVYFPSTISEINLEMFEGCTNLARVKISEDNPYYAERDGIVYNKAVTKVIMCPSGKGGNIILPDSVTEVGDGAFKGNVNITGIVIGKNVTLIGDAAFYKCVNLSSVTFDKGGTEDLVINPSARENMSSNSLATFYQCDALTSIVFPSRLVMFGGFRECANLSRVSFDDPETSRLEEIGSYALYKCSKLSYFECPKSLKVLETYAFSNCESLTSIDLPEGLIEMKDYALSSCPVLKNITIPSTVKYLGKAMFANNKVITSMTL
ncbi:MAG: leucine-rich repeat domain-containing protein, partial [Clostridiales bacterium]|nr:leucine-rich repeat domain-containing protein [Clostridiales bacterium]